MFVYQVVTKEGSRLLSLEELTAEYPVTGQHFNPATRAELQGQPKLAGFCGPMFNGYHNSAAVIRYESTGYYNDMV